MDQLPSGLPLPIIIQCVLELLLSRRNDVQVLPVLRPLQCEEWVIILSLVTALRCGYVCGVSWSLACPCDEILKAPSLVGIIRLSRLSLCPFQKTKLANHFVIHTRLSIYLSLSTYNNLLRTLRWLLQEEQTQRGTLKPISSDRGALSASVRRGRALTNTPLNPPVYRFPSASESLQGGTHRSVWEASESVGFALWWTAGDSSPRQPIQQHEFPIGRWCDCCSLKGG